MNASVGFSGKGNGPRVRGDDTSPGEIIVPLPIAYFLLSDTEF